jgi:LysR family glycine cleavage system transcriptional activator
MFDLSVSKSHFSAGPIPSLQALRILEAAVRLESFTGAAAELGLTHGAISRQVFGLESWTGKRLFKRAGRRMAPTESARALVTQTREALHMLSKAFGDPVVVLPRPGLRLSTTPSIARLWVLPALTALHAVHPGLISAIDTTTELVVGLSKEVDVALRYGPGSWPGVQSRLLGNETLFAVASPALLARIEDWRAAPLITTPFQSWGRWFDAAGEAPPLPHAAALQVPDSALALDAAALGLGVALARARMVQPWLDRGDLVAVDPHRIEDIYAYHLVWPIHSPRVVQISALGEWFDQAIRAASIGSEGARAGRRGGVGRPRAR